MIELFEQNEQKQLAAVLRNNWMFQKKYVEQICIFILQKKMWNNC